ncbi:hypothetical protein TUA1478L_29100 [Lactiplantibacillus plantarum]
MLGSGMYQHSSWLARQAHNKKRRVTAIGILVFFVVLRLSEAKPLVVFNYLLSEPLAGWE